MTVTSFRVDANPDAGLGHFHRSVRIASELARRGHRPVFVTRDREALARLAVGQGFDHIVGFAEDKDEINAILSPGPGLVIFDNGSTTHDMVAAVKEVGCFVVTFDDLGDGRYLADIAVDANLTESTNPQKMRTTTRYLLGPGFAVVSPHCRTARKKRKNFRDVHRVIVSCGGSDPAGVTPRIVMALGNYDTEVEIQLILGPAFAHRAELDKALLSAARTFEVVEAPDDLPTRLRAADVGILSGGVTLFEAAFLGLPSIVIAQNPAQLRNLPPFEKRGGIVNLGLAAHEPFANIPAELKLLRDRGKLRAMSEAQETYVDGKGLDRVVSAIRELLGT